MHWGTRWRSWLRHRATSRKGTGSIPNGVIGILIDIILPAALWLSASNRCEYPEYFLGGRSWQSYHLHVLSWNLGASTFWNPQGLSRPVMVLLYFFTVIIIIIVFMKGSACFLFLNPQDEVGPSISSSIALCSFVPLVDIVVLVLLFYLCPFSVHVVATFPCTVLFLLLCSVLPFSP